ncbi:adenine phosphoribosyltransferase [Neocallimastix lanati (nom. inval.)]|jgi:adenine phosphoribosyltransferase|uniref:adenine phosphoribosyltransferase n=1 Tax=Neocallimastix californiae TaxID=1754190 RepID=A0A1Y2D427_9FUNG|nr:adenine phosphoribosyltransferase [Neocallimastix sp. JGI-2020a]ORY54010.1 adenine phosphoribosyltransferase [Neocallimastix californiae]|eukprot:ORY54010.1 adenine phosphoribosyltransferase [Neocallimastix californiae]
MSDIELVKSCLRVIPDFPIKGIMFQDIFPIFENPEAVEAMINHFVNHIKQTHPEGVDAIVGLDARGFLFGPIIALRLKCKFVPIRKKGKLPGKTFVAQYKKEYGVDEFEIPADSLKENETVIIVDDLIATGGSAAAASELVKKCKATVKEFLFIIDLVDLKGSSSLDAPVYSMIIVHGE